MSSSSNGKTVQAVGPGETNRGGRAFRLAVFSVPLLNTGAPFCVRTSGRVTPTFSFPSFLVLTELYTLLLSRLFVPFCLPFSISLSSHLRWHLVSHAHTQKSGSSGARDAALVNELRFCIRGTGRSRAESSRFLRVKPAPQHLRPTPSLSAPLGGMQWLGEQLTCGGEKLRVRGGGFMGHLSDYYPLLDRRHPAAANLWCPGWERSRSCWKPPAPATSPWWRNCWVGRKEYWARAPAPSRCTTC